MGVIAYPLNMKYLFVCDALVIVLVIKGVVAPIDNLGLFIRLVPRYV